MEQEIETFLRYIICLKGAVMGQNRSSMEERVATGMQFGVLNFLAEHDSVTSGEVATHLSLSPSSATQLVERLVRDDLVERQADQEDRRVVHLKLTDNGRAERERVYGFIRERVGRLLGGLTTEERTELIRLHKKIYDTINS